MYVIGAVTQVEFAHDVATLVSRGGGTTRYRDVQSGEAKEGEAGEESKRGLECSNITFSKGSSRERKVGNFLITAEGDILRIFKSEGGVKDKADKDTTPVASPSSARRRRSPPSTPPGSTRRSRDGCNSCNSCNMQQQQRSSRRRAGSTSQWAARTARCCSCWRRCC